jgi:hypothetical protein
VAPGPPRLLFSEPRGVCFDKSGINVLVLRGFVRNPSFEANSHPPSPAMARSPVGPVKAAATPASTSAAGPFHDNGLIPDRNQVALLQTSKIIRQDIVNLAPGSRYWLQFYYNVRNCCGGTIDLTVRFAGSELQTFAAIQPGPRDQRLPLRSARVHRQCANGSSNSKPSPPAMPPRSSTPSPSSNATPAVSCCAIQASKPAAKWPPRLHHGAIAGWDAGGGRGVNVSGVGPFADNGANPDQDNVLFLQGAGTLGSAKPSPA